MQMITTIAGSLLTLIILLTINVVSVAQTVSTSKLVDAAKDRLNHQVRYDGRYISIPYPGGDVPQNIGVCTDVVIRSYRGIGVDLQKLVHEDISEHFAEYPSARIWGLSKPDSNIDHRRVPNLQVFFKRHGKSFTPTERAENYLPGDIVSWMLPGNLPHIGIVSDINSAESDIPLIIHNIGSGPVIEDILFSYKITGHYRYLYIE